MKWKNAEDEIDPARHSFDPATVPSPYLGADVINYLLSPRLPSQGAGESQIEAGIIDQQDRIRLGFDDFFGRLAKLLSKITVLPEHLPQSKNGCVADPICDLPASDLSHLRTAAADDVHRRPHPSLPAPPPHPVLNSREFPPHP